MSWQRLSLMGRLDGSAISISCCGHLWPVPGNSGHEQSDTSTAVFQSVNSIEILINCRKGEGFAQIKWRTMSAYRIAPTISAGQTVVCRGHKMVFIPFFAQFPRITST